VARSSSSLCSQIFRRFLAPVGNDVKRDLVAFAEVAQARLLDSRDMDEYILATAAIRRDEPKSLGRIEPFHRSCRHVRTPLLKHGGKREYFKNLPETIGGSTVEMAKFGA
jgi:hypothetical protein